MVHADATLASRLECTESLVIVDYIRVVERLYPSLSARSLRLDDGAYALFAGPDSPINRVSGLGFRGVVPCDTVLVAERFFADVGEPAQFDLCPLADSSLVSLLGERGYRIRLFLSAHVKPLPPDAASPQRESPVTVRVISYDEADTWALTVEQGFSGGPVTSIVHPSIAYAVSQKPDVLRFMAEVQGEPAGAAAMQMRVGLAIFSSASTRQCFRQLGVQTSAYRCSPENRVRPWL